MGISIIKPVDAVWGDIELLVITCGEGDVIIEQLKELGIPHDIPIIIPDISVVDREGEDFNYIWENVDELEVVYGMLSDDKSRLVFKNILNFKICHDVALLDEIYDSFERQYFDEELIHYASSDVFLDCGSYIGDTIEYYRKWSDDKFGKVYAFEADNVNYEILKEKYKNDMRIQPVKCGLWDEIGKVRFYNIGSGSGAIVEDGYMEIDADTIDHIVGGESVSFIKMDIEGAEYNALVGGRKTIERNVPALMISVYHKRDDFIRIPLLIKSICPQYQIYFRHYRKMSVQETVCYAIPRKSQQDTKSCL